jgi:hypothetical protein
VTISHSLGEPADVCLSEERRARDVEADHGHVDAAREHRAAASGSHQMLNSARA